MRTALAVAVVLGVLAPARGAPPYLPTPGRLDGNLSGVWTIGAGTRLVFTHTAWSRHRVEGTWDGRRVAGTADVVRRLDSSEAELVMRLDAAPLNVSGSWLVSRDRTRMDRSGWSLEREVPSGMVRLKLMTYNIKGTWHLGRVKRWKLPFGISLPHDYDAYDMRGLRNFLKEEKPDVVALQEVDHIQLPTLGSEADAAAAGLGYHVSFAPERGYKYHGVPAPFQEGVAMLVRKRPDLRFLWSRRHKLPKSPASPPDDIARGAVEVAADVGGRRMIRFVSAHLSYKRIYAASRRIQTAYLADMLPGAVVFMGDYNATDSSRSIVPLVRRCLNVFRLAYAGGPQGTAGDYLHDYKDQWRIDHILISSETGARPLSAWVAGREGDAIYHFADHRAVMAVVDFPVDR